MFNSSRTPVRQALSRLENERLIVRRPGKGTFVTSLHDRKQWWLSFSPFRKHFQEDWDKTKGQVLQVEERIPPDFVRDFFVLGGDRRVTYIVRRRSVCEKPVIVNRLYVHPRYSIREFIEAEKFFSLRVLLMEKFSAEITRIDDVLTATPPPDEEIANLLNVSPVQSLLGVRRYMYAEDMPVLIDMAYAMTDIWDYRVTFRKSGEGGILTEENRADPCL
jgi:GntR family transcriptional regulator